MKFTSVASARRALGATPVVLAATIAWTAAIGWLVTRQFLTFGYDDFDLAHDVQNLWNLLHGSLDSTILGIPWLGNHVSLILCLIAPVYALLPSPLTLVWLQTLALAAGVWPLYLLSRSLLDRVGVPFRTGRGDFLEVRLAETKISSPALPAGEDEGEGSCLTDCRNNLRGNARLQNDPSPAPSPASSAGEGQKAQGAVGAALVALLYLLNPALANVALYEFHTEAFATPTLLWMFYALQAQRYRQFVAAMVLALLCKENVALVVVFIGLLALVSGRRARWWAVPLIAGGGWFLICVLLIGPHFNRGEVGFVGLYAGLGSSGGEIVRTLLFHPWRVGTLLATRANAVYVAQLLAPVGFLALGAPLYLLTAAPILAQHMLSLRPTEQTILYHYTAPLLPSIMVATVFALRRVGFASLRRVPRVLVASAVLGAAGVTGVWWGAPARMKQPESASRFTAPDAADRAKQELVDDVPPNAPVVASFEFLARLANRAALYSFHNVVTGKKIISNQDYVLPPAVSWALIDFADPTIFAGSFYWGRPGGDARTRRMLTTGTWRTAAEAGSVVLFQRVDDASREAGAASAAPTRRVVLEQVPELRGWTVSALRARAGARVPIDWYWQLPMGTADGYWVYVAIVQDGRMLHREQRLACANVPLSTSQVVQERMTLLLPDDLAPGTYAIDGFVVRHETGRGAPAGKQLARLPLGSLEIVR